MHSYRILKFESMIKKTNSGKSCILCCCYFSHDHQFSYNTAFIISNFQKHFHQDNLSFVCLQFYKQNCLSILARKIAFDIQESIEMTEKHSHSVSSSSTFKPQKLL